MIVRPPPPVHADERARLVANATPVRLVSIDDVTVGQLVSLYFKLFLAAIPFALVIVAIWVLIYIGKH